MIVLLGEEDVELVEEKGDGAEAVLHFTSNISLNNSQICKQTENVFFILKQLTKVFGKWFLLGASKHFLQFFSQF